MSSESRAPYADGLADSDGNGQAIGRGVWTGVFPLLLALIVLGLAAGGAALARALVGPTGASGFLAWQSIAIMVWGGGLLLAALVYAVGVTSALRHAIGWQSAGRPRQAMAVHWTLLVTALLLLTPVVLALALPQHPAP